jgi:hypothetical protein
MRDKRLKTCLPLLQWNSRVIEHRESEPHKLRISVGGKVVETSAAPAEGRWVFQDDEVESNLLRGTLNNMVFGTEHVCRYGSGFELRVTEDNLIASAVHPNDLHALTAYRLVVPQKTDVVAYTEMVDRVTEVGQVEVNGTSGLAMNELHLRFDFHIVLAKALYRLAIGLDTSLLAIAHSESSNDDLVERTQEYSIVIKAFLAAKVGRIG